MEYRSNKNVVFACQYHVIFCPKYRRKVLVGEVENRLKAIAREVAEAMDVEIIEMETDQDHIHLLVSVDPQWGIHRFVKALKGRSSRLLRAEFPHLRRKLPTLWSNSYFVTTVGGATLTVVKQYIENQQTSERPKEREKWARYLETLS
ncbi:transposase-related protein [Ectothiorhodospira sp. PHS-1]|uniref:IS200/IS605 family transposase n=1 Tax=Ectothiorhodospira sp. PHS-1 TaxID=519989 RepID=UPI00024A8482|nr:IS200/IS605 family transposase [Ectothiorhodospira sp. PHS-1]EHQ53386.1 transposase-related protein [Ectothiorhodospira sp. PHS-1]